MRAAETLYDEVEAVMDFVVEVFVGLLEVM